MRKLYILLGLLIIIFGFDWAIDRFVLKASKTNRDGQNISNRDSFQYQSPSLQTAPEAASSDQKISTAASESPLPDSYLISDVPFQSQAPYANWDELHDEACEEASVILVKYFLQNQNLSAQTMDEEILKMVAWQVKNWGGHKDLTVKETAEMAEEFYGLKTKTKTNITIADIKKEVAQNHPVIVPTAGRLLGNPNYRRPGPIYHMLVVIGFSGNRIITQDVGTRKGEHYEYGEKIFFNAVHDWNGAPENIEDGAKAMLVLSKNA